MGFQYFVSLYIAQRLENHQSKYYRAVQLFGKPRFKFHIEWQWGQIFKFQLANVPISHYFITQSNCTLLYTYVPCLIIEDIWVLNPGWLPDIRFVVDKISLEASFNFMILA